MSEDDLMRAIEAANHEARASNPDFDEDEEPCGSCDNCGQNRYHDATHRMNDMLLCDHCAFLAAEASNRADDRWNEQ